MRIVILANSYVKGGRSIAGKDTDTWKWIRFVIDGEDNVSNSNKLEPQQLEPLRIYDIEFVEPASLKHHPENHIISAEICLQESSSVDRDEVGKYSDSPPNLWSGAVKRDSNSKNNTLIHGTSFNHTVYINDVITVVDPGETFDREESYIHSYSTYMDKVDYSLVGEGLDVPQSLYLLKVQDLTCFYGNYDCGRRDISRWVAHFSYKGKGYELVITDDEFTKKLDREKKYPIKISNHLVISLSDVYQGFCYKLVAAIL